jgi:glycosyltransferase involved in cell wall biosynthesis
MMWFLLIPVLLAFAVAAANAVLWPRLRAAQCVELRLVSVLIPARDEAANIAACLDAVLRQGEIICEVLVYDDHSTDDTAHIVTDYARNDGRVHLIAASPLPPGWCGKNFACDRLAVAASSDWLLFLDADARLKDGAINGLLAEAQVRKITFLSAWPGLVMQSFWERVLMPMLNFVVFTLWPAPLSLTRRDASLGLAHGACILAHRQTYFRVGGHHSVRGEIFEDTQLAKRWRAAGERGFCLDGQDIVRVRMYGSFAEIWHGFQKNFYPAFRRDASFWMFLTFHAWLLIAPMLLLAFGYVWFALATALGPIITRGVLALRFRQPLWSALLHPLSEAILIVLGISSWRRCKSGRGVEWKGRAYQQRNSF